MATKEAGTGMTSTRERAIAELRDVVLRAVANQDASVWLFGSSARGDARKDSDIDIGILPRGDIPPSLFADLAAEIEESDIPYDVDLFDLRYIEPALLESVRREGVRWRK